MKIARYLLIPVATFGFFACSKAPATKTESPTQNVAAGNLSEVRKTSVDPKVIEYLLTSSASDFHKHPPGDIAHFRNVRLGHVMSADNKEQYRICGEFSRVGHETEDEWTPFATLKTSGYEQYIGGLTTSYCEGSSFVADDVGDLSPQLQMRFDSLRMDKK